jgi:hypothetical protein
MGERGPVPKRSTERRRRNKAEGGEVTTASVPSGVVQAPALDLESPHPLAVDWYASLAESGQAQFYEPSDWQVARLVAHELTRMLNNRFSAQGYAAIMGSLTELLTTEGSRRRVRLEIERGAGEKPAPAGVTALSDYRDALGG